MDELRTYLIDAIEDDWVYFAEIESMILELGGSLDDVLQKAGKAAAQLVREGVIVPGELTEADGFVAWHSTPAESAARIDREVAAMIRAGTRPDPGDICWFDLPTNSNNTTPPHET